MLIVIVQVFRWIHEVGLVVRIESLASVVRIRIKGLTVRVIGEKVRITGVGLEAAQLLLLLLTEERVGEQLLCRVELAGSQGLLD